MPKVMIDPIKAKEQFERDLAAMRVGPSDATAFPSSEIKHRLLGKNFGLSSFKFNRWSAELEEAQTLDDALDPTFWANHVETIQQDKTGGARKLHGRGDIIEVRKLDSGLYAELLVVETGRGYVRTVLVREAKLPEVSAPEESPLTTRWNVGNRCHEVIRKADSVVMQGGFQTKAAAVAWIADHLGKMAA